MEVNLSQNYRHRSVPKVINNDKSDSGTIFVTNINHIGQYELFIFVDLTLFVCFPYIFAC